MYPKPLQQKNKETKTNKQKEIENNKEEINHQKTRK